MIVNPMKQWSWGEIIAGIVALGGLLLVIIGWTAWMSVMYADVQSMKGTLQTLVSATSADSTMNREAILQNRAIIERSREQIIDHESRIRELEKRERIATPLRPGAND